ncbi:MAG: hypothetical protein KBB14_04190 [Thermoanaerobaculia bacterium]|nr:hypothetical protein [Thermoanaerobaculia bacterium]
MKPARGYEMPFSDTELDAILTDGTKRIEGDIAWADDEDHSPSSEFRVEVRSSSGWPLFVRGSINAHAGTLTFALILKTEGRIYALDLGKDHHNPQCNQVGEKHKHRWTQRYRDKEAYVPSDIQAPVNDPCAVWTEFCIEARITHNGTLATPPVRQQELF